ncbi:TPA: hypothetical protein RJD49_000465 [Legionella pneumophila]|nr:hypothetical protein [Legionella pneumophila]HDV5804844.1 hypothetical protein [Legionella pneumophila]
MTIECYSIDGDECILRKEYDDAPDSEKFSGKAVIYTNLPLIKKIKHESAKNKLQKIIVFNGSNRQSMFMEQLNALREKSVFRGSFCLALQRLCDYLKVELDKTLLPDITRDLEYGTTFNRIMDEVLNNVEWLDNKKIQHIHVPYPDYNENWHAKLDPFKRILLFAQMQKIRNDHPDEDIIFNFIDDKDDILSTLEKYFINYSHLIPHGVTLRLNHYDGGSLSLYASIKGTGSTYSNYRQIVKDMHENIYNLEAFAETINPNKKNSEIPSVRQILEHEFFISDPDDVINCLDNKKTPFVIRKSKSQISGYIMFTAVYKTSQGIFANRYGINTQGELYKFFDSQIEKMEIDSEGIIAALERDIVITKMIIEKTENLSKIPWKSQPEKKNNDLDYQENGENAGETNTLESASRENRQESLCSQLRSCKFFTSRINHAESELNKKQLPFLIRPSRASSNEYYLFTTVCKTSKGIFYHRYGIDRKGDLYSFDKDGTQKVNIIPLGIIATLKKEIVEQTQKIDKVKDIAQITWIPEEDKSSNPSIKRKNRKPEWHLKFFNENGDSAQVSKITPTPCKNI